MLDITIPKLNTVDVSYTLVEWLFRDGDMVPPDAPVAVLETSKAAQDLICDQGGILHRAVEAPAECQLGAVIGRLFESEDERGKFISARAGGGAAPELPRDPEPVVTQPARDLMARHGITPERVRMLGKKVVKSTDVERLIEEPGDRSSPGEHTPSRAQRAVAEVVTRAHLMIPAAFSLIKIYAADALALRGALADQDGIVIGLPELLVKCVASCHESFPLFFALVRDDGSAVLSPRADVGVTVDVGTGLYIPVVRDAARASIQQVASTLMQFRIKALRGQFEESDLAGANVAISLHDDPGIVLAQPLIFPPLACMLALGAGQDELCLADSGGVQVRTYFHLGLAYDHRVINGREAALFLREIKDIFESRGMLSGLCEKDGGRHAE
jgi:2-oxoglutarate dehydrogenase E2 component (dihydrolipoamide succinyltransferase)